MCGGAANSCSHNLDSIGEHAWPPDGIAILGFPVGSAAFVEAHAAGRLAEETELWGALPAVPDLQCAWQILIQSASPRCNHMLRALPPSASAAYAQGHDEGMWQAVDALMAGLPGTDAAKTAAKHIASLPMRLGGLGVRSATRTALAAYWASWADALPMLAARCPAVCSYIVEALEGIPNENCLQELVVASEHLRSEGFLCMPAWSALADGTKPEQQPAEFESGEWHQGWQFYASSTREHFFRRRGILASSCSSYQAHLRSRSGPGAASALMGCPTLPEFVIEPHALRALILDRVRLPFPLTDIVCEGCGAELDNAGFHRSNCMLSGRVRKRARPLELAAARVCKEAGAKVQTDVFLRNLNMAVHPSDNRRIEVIASELPCFAGAQLAIDVTLRTSCTARGAPKSRADVSNGVVCDAARYDKERKYPELLEARRCKLVVLALEVGGRFSKETMTFLEELAWARGRSAPIALRFSACLAWRRRWSRVLGVAAATAWASSVLAPAEECTATFADGECPCDGDIWSREA